MHTRIQAPNARRAGFTLVESLIAVTLLAVLFLAVAQTSSKASNAFDEGSAEVTLDRSAHRALERMSGEIELARLDAITAGMSSAVGATTISLHLPTGFAGGAVQWGPEVRYDYELEPGELDDGKDNDGDGLVDEHRVVRLDAPGTPDERRVVLASGVAEYLEGELQNGNDDNGNGFLDERGLTFSATGSVVTIRLTCQRLDEGGHTVQKTVSTSVRLRNRDAGG